MTELKLVAAGLVPASKATAYTVPTGKALTLKAISMVNTNAAAARLVNVYIKPVGGSSLRIWPKDFSLAGGASHADTISWCLSAGDIIEWDATGGGTDVDGVISGIVVQAQ